MSDETRWRLIWFSFAAGIVTTELYTLRRNVPHGPATHFLRWFFLSRHPHWAARTAGSAAYLGSVLWLWRHLIENADDEKREARN